MTLRHSRMLVVAAIALIGLSAAVMASPRTALLFVSLTRHGQIFYSDGVTGITLSDGVTKLCYSGGC